MKLISKTNILSVALCATCALNGVANGAVMLIVQPVGPNVVATFSGTVDLTGLSNVLGGGTVSTSSFSGFLPAEASVGIGGSAEFEPWGGGSNSGPSSTGGGTVRLPPDTSTGQFFGLGGPPVDHHVWVPAGYTSGDPIAGSSTWENATIQTLGLVNGTYDYSWGNDSAVLVVVPEPSSVLLIGMGTLAVCSRRRRRRATVN